jgi:TRAP-type C4-dicarboxylate transport system, small permease component
MKVYKQIMNGLAWFEKAVLIAVSVVITAFTFANVLSRFVFHASLSWSEELVVNLFIIMIMFGCSLCAREGTLISLSLIFDMLKAKGKKIFVVIITIFNSAFCILLMNTGFAKMAKEMKMNVTTPSLGWPQWIFTILLPIGALFLLIHTIEFFVDVMANQAECVKDCKEEGNN